MRITKTYCDICQKECHEKRYGEVAGCVYKMSQQGEMQEMVFIGHYCEEHITEIVGFIEKLKNESTGSDKPTKLTDKGESGSE